jgi:hypothetical protein
LDVQRLKTKVEGRTPRLSPQQSPNILSTDVVSLKGLGRQVKGVVRVRFGEEAMLKAHVEIKDANGHDPEAVVLAEALLKMQYDLICHRIALHRLFGVVGELRSQVKLGPFSGKVPPELGSTPIGSVMDAWREFAATNLPTFTVELSERTPSGHSVTPLGIPIAKD